MVATGPTLHCSMGVATKDVASACAQCVWASSPHGSTDRKGCGRVGKGATLSVS